MRRGLTDTTAATEAEARTEPGGITLTTVTVGDLVFEARGVGPDDGELVILLHGFPETSPCGDRNSLR